LPIAFAPELRPEVCGPKVVVSHLLLHGVDDGTKLVVQRMELPVGIAEVEGLHPFGDEIASPVEL
jgi:hypothetical protein